MTDSTDTPTTATIVGTPQPFLRLLDLNCCDVQQHRDAVQQLRAGDLAAIIVRKVYDPDFMKSVTERLEQHDPPFLKTHFPEKFRSWFYGRNLNLLETDPISYFREADTFHQQMQQLFDGSHSLQDRLFALLSQLDAGRPYRAAPGPEPGQQYMITTFRGHAEGGYIPAHCDNEQTLRPAYQHLETLVSDHMYSMVLMIGPSEDGGALEVFDYRVEPQNARLMNDDSAAKHPELSSLSSAQLPLQAGDLVVVDSGRYLHRVTPVQGSTTRWVACSFMAHALERQAVYCWG